MFAWIVVGCGGSNRHTGPGLHAHPDTGHTTHSRCTRYTIQAGSAPSISLACHIQITRDPRCPLRPCPSRQPGPSRNHIGRRTWRLNAQSLRARLCTNEDFTGRRAKSRSADPTWYQCLTALLGITNTRGLENRSGYSLTVFSDY